MSTEQQMNEIKEQVLEAVEDFKAARLQADWATYKLQDARQVLQSTEERFQSILKKYWDDDKNHKVP